MEKIKTCIIGGGNISNTRHIPAILKNKHMQLAGVVSDNPKNIQRTQDKFKLPNSFLIDKNQNIQEQLSGCSWFMEQCDAVVIGTPPMDHFSMTKACLSLNKHVLVEKPMMMQESECLEVMKIASEKHRILNVMHSFQFADGIMKMDKRFQSGEFGELQSVVEIQLTNRQRRLPPWYNNLPMGLYYDEAAHFFYVARRFGGELNVLNASAQFNKSGENTPRFIQAQLMAGKTPVQMFMNFNSPICEWGVMLLCEKKIAIYDFFKDVLIVINNDNQHLPKDVLRVSSKFTLGFWGGFIYNGFKMISHNLLYGHDKAIQAYANAILTGKVDEKIGADLGLEVVRAMNQVITKAKENN